jgi:hypothetical protein
MGLSFRFLQFTALSLVFNVSFYRSVFLFSEGSNRAEEIYFSKLPNSTSIQKINIPQPLSQTNISNYFNVSTFTLLLSERLADEASEPSEPMLAFRAQ